MIQVVAPPPLFFNVHVKFLSATSKNQIIRQWIQRSGSAGKDSRSIGAMEYWINDKSQNSSIKLQINLKIQYSMTKTSLEFRISIIVNGWILGFVIWYSRLICNSISLSLEPPMVRL
jgi:hypothetical protein